MNYVIDDGNGNVLTAGLQGCDHARKVAQEMADERGESVWLYENVEGSESEEVKPATSVEGLELLDQIFEILDRAPKEFHASRRQPEDDFFIIEPRPTKGRMYTVKVEWVPLGV